MTPISAIELASWLGQSSEPARALPLLLDVREPWEFEACHLPESRLIPMREIPARAAELDASRPIVCICHHGSRSMQVARFLEAQGITQVFNLTGGVERWSHEVDPSFPRY
jgi:rhodanese-related sulfurtransferase